MESEEPTAEELELEQKLFDELDEKFYQEKKSKRSLASKNSLTLPRENNNIKSVNFFLFISGILFIFSSLIFIDSYFVDYLHFIPNHILSGKIFYFCSLIFLIIPLILISEKSIQDKDYSIIAIILILLFIIPDLLIAIFEDIQNYAFLYFILFIVIAIARAFAFFSINKTLKTYRRKYRNPIISFYGWSLFITTTITMILLLSKDIITAAGVLVIQYYIEVIGLLIIGLKMIVENMMEFSWKKFWKVIITLSLGLSFSLDIPRIKRMIQSTKKFIKFTFSSKTAVLVIVLGSVFTGLVIYSTNPYFTNTKAELLYENTLVLNFGLVGRSDQVELSEFQDSNRVIIVAISSASTELKIYRETETIKSLMFQNETKVLEKRKFTGIAFVVDIDIVHTVTINVNIYSVDDKYFTYPFLLIIPYVAVVGFTLFIIKGKRKEIKDKIRKGI